MCLRRFVTQTDGVNFVRTLNYFSHTARIKYFGRRFSLVDLQTLRRDADGLKKPPPPTSSNG
jgi:hypothetical protein